MSEAHTQSSEPIQAVSKDAIAAFLAEMNSVTSTDKMPVPRLNQFFDKPSTRRRFGHVFVALLLDSSGEEPPSTEQTFPNNNTIARGKELFAKLDEFRDGPEALISPDSRQVIHGLAESVDTPTLRVGRQVLFALQDHPAYGTAADAYLAVELYAISQTGVSAA